MRKSKKTKERLTVLRKECQQRGGHEMRTTDKRVDQQRCARCDSTNGV